MKITLAKFLFCVLAILILSITLGAALQVISASDKLMHFVAFLILSFLLWVTYTLPRQNITSVLILGTFGFGIELLKYFVPYRSFSLLDLAADICGVIVGGGVLYKLLYCRKALFHWPVKLE